LCSFTSYFFAGTIDDTAIYTTALTPSQIVVAIRR
jgi:hypothetical protein